LKTPIIYINFVIAKFIFVKKHILPYFWFDIWQLKLKWFQACSEVGAVGSDPPFPDKVVDLKDAFWRFLRPHTIRGTALGSAWVALNPSAMCFLQLHSSSYNWTDFHFIPWLQCFSVKSVDRELKFDKVVSFAQSILWSFCSDLWEWLYSWHQSNIWH
jgi:hypothetical protein